MVSLVDPAAILKSILDKEGDRIRTSYLGEDVIFGLIEVIRSLDYQAFILGHNLREGDEELLEKYKFGWSLPFIKLYRDLDLSNVPIFASEKESIGWADSVIQHGGSIQLCNQLLDYKKAGLLELEQTNENSFIFRYLVEHSYEYYEKLSLAHYHELTNRVLEAKVKELGQRLPKMRKDLEDIVNLIYGKFISYQATEEVDRFYSRFGYLYMMTTQVIDEFGENDIFGGYSYKDYLDVTEYAIKSAIMHRDCCMALAEKTSHKVHIRNLLSYGFSQESFISTYSEYLGWSREKLRHIHSCLVLDKENYSYHLSYPKASAAPYFQLGTDTLIRSSFGCLDRPVFFLNRELKRRFPTDYFNAVNNREKRFREQLYSLFDNERIIRINDNIDIKINNNATDVDAVMFDKQRNVLGLFQLKWQDSFYTSMKERFSRISNLIPKSVEWIEKVSEWMKNNDPNTILNKLKIKDHSGNIDQVYLFVIGRNHVHFTNHKLDERAVWASWYQVVETATKIKDPTNANPIAELAAKLKFFSPDNRINFERADEIDNHSFRFAEYHITIEKKIKSL